MIEDRTTLSNSNKKPGVWRRLERCIRKKRKKWQKIILLRLHILTNGRVRCLSKWIEENLGLILTESGPTITVIMPVCNTQADMLSAAIISVRDQIYKNWELIIIDEKSTNKSTIKTIIKFAEKDKRIKSYFRSENGKISEALNDGVRLAKGEFIAVLNHNDTLDVTALNWVARTIIANPLTDYIYTDEDKLSKDGNTCYEPFYKPDWSPEYFLAMMYTSHLGVYRAEILKSIGGYRSEFDGAHDYDLTLRFSGQTDKVIHIPRVLYHRRTREQSTAETHEAKTSAALSARKSITEFLNSRDEKFVIGDGPYPGQHKVQFLPRGNPLISIIIPTANKNIIVNQQSERLIDAIIESITTKTTYLNYEIVVVHNGNLLPEQINYFSSNSKIKLVHYISESFNLSDKINLGSSKSSGDYLLLTNDDIRIISPDWIEQMVGMLQREGVGVVGPKLLYLDENIQHAGVVLLRGLPGHVYHQSPKSLDGYGCGLKITRNYLALTGACTMTPKWLFDKVGGYGNKYPVNYNDIDYCLKLHRMGFRSVYIANVELYHFEGATRENTGSVSDSELRMFQEDWGDIYRFDPYYNPNLNQCEPYK